MQILFHHGPVRLANFSHDGRLLVTASADGTAVVWDVRTGQPVGTPLQHQGGVLQACFSPDDRIVLTAGEDGIPKLYQMLRTSARRIGDDANLLHDYEKINGKVEALAFSPDGKMLAAGGFGGTARVYQTDDTKVVASLTVPSSVFALSFRPGPAALVGPLATSQR